MNYTVVRGDTLGTIAQKFLGSSTKWREVWSANSQVTDPNKLSPGQILRIPLQSQAQTALVPATQLNPITQSVMRDVTGTAKPSIFDRVLNDKKLLILIGVGVLGAAYLAMKNKANA